MLLKYLVTFLACLANNLRTVTKVIGEYNKTTLFTDLLNSSWHKPLWSILSTFFIRKLRVKSQIIGQYNVSIVINDRRAFTRLASGLLSLSHKYC